jgi:acetolactate synthase-1/2/3 large subunit
MTGAEFILTKISEAGVRTLSIVPGAHIDHLTSAVMAKTSPVKPIFCTSELSAGYMADGYARARRGLGVIVVNGGPGFHGLSTALKVALLERTPLLVISGDAPDDKNAPYTFHGAREGGMNDFLLSQALCKHTKRVHTAEQLPKAMDEAIEKALERPFGPAHLIIPYDLIKNPIESSKSSLSVSPEFLPPLLQLEQGLPELETEEPRLALLLGDLLWESKSLSTVHKIVHKQSIPVLTTYKAKGVISELDPLCFGNVGFAPSATAVNILKNGGIRTVVAVDVDWNERNTAGWHPDLWNGKKIINFVTDPLLAARDKNAILVGDLSMVFSNQNSYKTEHLASRRSWVKSLNNLRIDLPVPAGKEERTVGGAEAVSILSSQLPAGTNIVVDAGSIRIHVGCYWQFAEPHRLYTSDIVASMGWAIAAGVGIAAAEKTSTVVLTGDGSMLMQGTDLVTAAVNRLPLLFVVFDNAAYASVESRVLPLCEPSTESIPIGHTDWVGFSKACGVPAIKVYDVQGLKDALKSAVNSLENHPSTIVVASPRKTDIPMKEMNRSYFARNNSI